MLDHALELLEMGLSVCPINKGTKVPPFGCTWKEQQDVLPTAELVSQRFSQHKDCNLSNITGRGSMTVVLDGDSKDACEWIEKTFPYTPIRVVTGGGADRKQYYFKYPKAYKENGKRVKTCAGVIYPNVDVRGDGGLAVLPPSVHKSGNLYEWEILEDFDFDLLPEIPVELLESTEEVSREPLKTGVSVEEGRRNDTLAKVAGKFAVSMTDSELYAMCTGYNTLHFSPPLPDSEVRTVVTSIKNKDSIKNPTLEDVGVILGESFFGNPELYKADVTIDGIPEKLLDPPGVLKDIAEYYNLTARRPQPLFAITSALAIASTILGRRYRTNKNNYTSLYFLCVAKSATGKEHPITVCEDILNASGCANLIGPKGYTSESGVLTSLVDKPRQLSIIDEFGRKLEEVKNSSNSTAASAITCMMESFGRLHGALRAKGFSMIGNNAKQRKAMNDMIVIKPALSVLAMSTPSSLYENVTTRLIQDGFVNRFIPVISDAERCVSVDPDICDVPFEIVEWCKEYAGLQDNLLVEVGTDDPNDITTINFDPVCIDMLMDYDRLCISRANQLEKYGLDDLPGRLKEQAMRLSLILCLCSRKQIIGEEELEWSIQFVEWNYHRFYDRVKKSISSSDFESDKMEFLSALRKLNIDTENPGITARDMNKQKPFSKHPKRIKKEILDDLTESGLVKLFDTRAGKPGRARMAYVAVAKRF